MALFGNGILGGFSGKVGTVVGSTWRGLEVMKSKPKKKRTRKFTEKQQAQRLRFDKGIKFASTMGSVFKKGFGNSAPDMTGVNRAASLMLKQAMTGEGPNLRIDYSKVLVSKGSLDAADQATAVAGAGRIDFTWLHDNPDPEKSSDNDKVLLVAYCEEKDRCTHSLGSATRIAGTARLDTPAFAGKKVQTWISFISADGKKTADSIYTGELTVQ